MTQEKQYKLFKLVSGDDIICTTLDDLDNVNLNTIISIFDPVVVKTVKLPRGLGIYESYILQPWLRYISQTEYRIPVNNIIAIVNVNEEETKGYVDYLNSKNLALDEEEEKEVIDNMKEINNFLEKLKSGNFFGESSAEEETNPTTKRILH